MRPVRDAFHEWVDDDHQQRRDAGCDRETIELYQNQKADKCLGHHEHRGLCDRDLPRWDRPGTCTLDASIKVAIDQVIPRAAGAAHGKRADEEQHDMPQARETAIVHSGETDRPPARHQK